MNSYFSEEYLWASGVTNPTGNQTLFSNFISHSEPRELLTVLKKRKGLSI